MSATLNAPEIMIESLRAFVEDEHAQLSVVSGPGGTVRIVPTADHRQSTTDVLYAGGWIACGTAFRMAERLGVRTRTLGKLLDHLDVKIRACELGCFA